jgi:hypothetical protein
MSKQADIVRIIGDYVRLKKAGARNYAGPCPFNGEKTPSSTEYSEQQTLESFQNRRLHSAELLIDFRFARDGETT